VYGWSLKSEILTSYSVDFGNESRFYVSEQVGALFLVEMCEPDGSEASDTFSMGAIFSRVMKRGLYVSKCNMLLLHYHGSVQKPKRRRKTAKVGKRRRKSTKDAKTRRKTADNVVILKNLSKLVNTIHT